MQKEFAIRGGTSFETAPDADFQPCVFWLDEVRVPEEVLWDAVRDMCHSKSQLADGRGPAWLQ